MIKVTRVQRTITTGVELFLTNEQVGTLCYALKDYLRLIKEHGGLNGGHSWPHLEDEWLRKLEAARTSPNQELIREEIL